VDTGTAARRWPMASTAPQYDATTLPTTGSPEAFGLKLNRAAANTAAASWHYPINARARAASPASVGEEQMQSDSPLLRWRRQGWR
jgi:hypothetical protein